MALRAIATLVMETLTENKGLGALNIQNQATARNRSVNFLS
jgi:hypothetical protein